MATADSVKTKIQGLITKANDKTGRSDADMTNAVNALVSGYNPNGIIPSGTKSITANGTHDVKNYASATVNVPVGTTPTGTVSITTNGTHDVTNYASANVNVPVPSGYIKPSGTKSITANGTHDVTNYASATVNVPIPSGYVKPSGSINITTNGTHTVTNYASAVVNVPTPPEYTVIRTVTVSSNATNTERVLISADPFIKAHYAADGLTIFLFPNTPIANEIKVIHSIFQTNHNMGNSSTARYGLFYYNYSATAINPFICATKLNGSGYNASLRVNSSGNLSLWIASNYILKAGTYTAIMTCTS